MSDSIPLFPSVQHSIMENKPAAGHTNVGKSFSVGVMMQPEMQIATSSPLSDSYSSDESYESKGKVKKVKKSKLKKKKYDSHSKKKRRGDGGGSVSFLPNGNIVVSAPDECKDVWVVDRDGDFDILQYGSTYRLDIPVYDILRSARDGSAVQKVSSDKMIQLMHKAPSRGVVSTDTKSVVKRKSSDLYVLNRTGRYFVAGRSCKSTTGNTPAADEADVEDMGMYRQWMVRRVQPSTTSSGAGAGRVSFNSSFIPLPLPLTSSGAQTATRLAQSAVSAAIGSTHGSTVVTEAAGQMFATDAELHRREAASLASNIGTVTRARPSAPCVYIYSAHMQGRLVWLQQLAAGAQKGSAAGLWRSITDRQMAVLQEGITKNKCAPLHNDSCGDETVGMSMLWKRVLSECPLRADLRLAYLSHIRSRRGGSVGPSDRTSNGDTCRYLQGLLAQTERDVKNRLAARSLSRGGGYMLTAPPPPRLQEDMDCLAVDIAAQLCSVLLSAGNAERVVAFVQALLETNLAIVPSLQQSHCGTLSHDESRARVFAECEVYWESEFPRMGEARESTAVGGYMAWCAAGRPDEGWTSGGGQTGHRSTYLSSETDTPIVVHAVDEPTVNEYMSRAEQCLSILQSCCDRMDTRPVDVLLGQSTDRDSHLSPPAAAHEVTPGVDREVVNRDGIEDCTSLPEDCPESTSGLASSDSVGSGKRTRAAAYFSYDTKADENEEVWPDVPLSVAVAKNASTTGPQVPTSTKERDDDGMVYSRVHGYRIKIDGTEDTSLAYKKVLGDINDSDVVSWSTDDLLKKYLPATAEEAKRKADEEAMPGSKLPSPAGSYCQWARTEDVLHGLQWRPLRVGASTDLAAAEMQPDRVVFYEDLKAHICVLQSLQGRDRLVIRCLEALGLRFPSSQISHATSTLYNSTGSDFLSDNWREVLEICIDTSSRSACAAVPRQNQAGTSASFLRRVESLLCSLRRHESQHPGARGGLTGITQVHLTPADVICVCSLDLLRRHVACTWLGLASPLTFVMKIVNDIMTIGQAQGRPGLSPVLSASLQVALKCILLELYAVESKLNGLLDAAKRECAHAPPGSSEVEGEEAATVSCEMFFREKCMRLLEGEDLSIDASTDRQSTRGMAVWTAYIDAEEAVGNISQARKACAMSLQAVGQHAATLSTRVTWSDRSDDLLASLSPHQSTAANLQQWQAAQGLVWRSVNALVRIPNSLAVYWRALKFTLSDIFSLPRHLSVSPLLNRPHGSVKSRTLLSVHTYAEAVYTSLLVLQQLVGGGSELSQVPTSGLLLRKGSSAKESKKSSKKKSKTKRNSMSAPEVGSCVEGDSVSPIVEAGLLRNMRLKMDAICEDIWECILLHAAAEERGRRATESNIQAVRLEIWRLVLPEHLSNLSDSVRLCAWNSFLQHMHIRCTRNGQPETGHQPSFMDCVQEADAVFGDWIDRLKVFLFDGKFAKKPSIWQERKGCKGHDIILGTSREMAGRGEDGPLGGEYAGVFEACFCESGKICAAEEQGILQCIEQLTLARVQFVYHTLFCWKELCVIPQAGCGTITMSMRSAVLRRVVLSGLEDFPLHSTLSHVLLCLELGPLESSGGQFEIGRSPGGPAQIRQHAKYFARKLFAVGLDSVCVLWRVCSNIHTAITAMTAECNDSGASPLSAAHSYNIRSWSGPVLQLLLSLIEKTMLRSLRNSALDLSYTSFDVFLRSCVSSASHAGDVGSISHRRKCDLLWRLYLRCEVVNLCRLLNVGNSSDAVDAATSVEHRRRDNLKTYMDTLQIRLSLFFSGDEWTGSTDATAVVVGRDVSVLQGSLRCRSLLFCDALGEVILGDVVREQFARQLAGLCANKTDWEESEKLRERGELLTRCLKVVEGEAIDDLRRLAEQHGVMLRTS